MLGIILKKYKLWINLMLTKLTTVFVIICELVN